MTNLEVHIDDEASNKQITDAFDSECCLETDEGLDTCLIPENPTAFVMSRHSHETKLMDKYYFGTRRK